MADAIHSRIPAPTQVTRRGLIVSALIAAATPAAVAAIPKQEMGPFLLPLKDGSGGIAVCSPASKITHARAYALRDGRTILAERLEKLWCNDGGGWRECAPDEFSDDVVGYVMAIMLPDGDRFAMAGSSRLAG